MLKGDEHPCPSWGFGPLSGPQMVGANVRNRFGQGFVIRMGVGAERWLHAWTSESDRHGGAPDQLLAGCVAPDEALLSQSQVLHM